MTRPSHSLGHPLERALRLAVTFAVVLAITLATTRRAHASPPPVAASPITSHTVLVLPLDGEGLHANDRASLDDHLRLAFEHPDLTVLGRELDAASHASSASLASCPDGSCLRALGREHRASYVVAATVVADGRDYIASILVIAVEGEGPANVIDASCTNLWGVRVRGLARRASGRRP